MAVNYSKPEHNIKKVSAQIHHKIIEAIKDIKYGSLTIIVQDGHIIQLDKNEKIRLS